MSHEIENKQYKAKIYNYLRLAHQVVLVQFAKNYALTHVKMKKDSFTKQI